MSSNYSGLVKRLSAYRNNLHLTQAEMGTKLGVSQSHYHKLEMGIKVVSMHSLKIFMEHGEDVVFLLTGEDMKNGGMGRYFGRCKTQYGKVELYKLFMWLVSQGIKLQYGFMEDMPDHYYKELRALEEGLNAVSIWEGIRAVEKLTQIEMARLLDINIKRYRRIEKGESEPNAEILVQLYQKLKYSPMIVLNQRLFYEDRINKVWDGFPDPVKRKLESFIVIAIELINEYESKG